LLIRAGFVNRDGTPRPPKSWEEICGKKFQGTGVVQGNGVQLGAPAVLPGCGPFPVIDEKPAAGDVITLRIKQTLFRARIASVSPQGRIEIDFSREQLPGVTTIPAEIASAPEVEVKIFSRKSYAVAMTRFDTNGNLAVTGFSPMAGNSWLYLYGWENGAAFISEDGTKCQLDDPSVEIALQHIVDCYDEQGGFQKVNTYVDSPAASTLHPFIAGRMAMFIDTNWMLSTICSLRPGMAFTVVPAPIPEARLREGFAPIAWVGGYAYAIPSTARHPDGGWDLIRFLSSAKATELMLEVSAERIRAAGQTFIPPTPIRKDLVAWSKETYLQHDFGVTDRLRSAYDLFLSLEPTAKYRPITPVGNKLWEGQKQAEEIAAGHTADVHEALTLQTQWVQENLDRYLHPPTGPRINWGWFIATYLVLLVAGAAALVWTEVRWRRAGLGKRDWVAGYVSVSPWLLGFIIFGAGPILFSLIISFCRYDVLNPAQFIGFENYTRLLGFHHDPLTHLWQSNDRDFWRSLANTAFMLVGVPIGLVLGLLLAMLLDQSFRGIGIFRTIYYLPSIVPAVASFLLWMWIFDPTRGLLNQTLMGLGATHPPFWLVDPAWAKPALLIMGLWGVGGGMLIWLAGLKGIPTELYEAAQIDGAGMLRRFFHITLPMLSPYIFFNTVMGIIGTLQVFEAAYIMTDGGPQNATMFYVYKLFNEAFRYLDIGMASAMAWILFILVLSLTLLQLWVSKKWVHYD
jgi:multiple sugar transport system permease protein